MDIVLYRQAHSILSSFYTVGKKVKTEWLFLLGLMLHMGQGKSGEADDSVIVLLGVNDQTSTEPLPGASERAFIYPLMPLSCVHLKLLSFRTNP